MATNAELSMRSPIELTDTSGTYPVTLFTYTGAPDGDAEPWTSSAIGSLYFRTDATDDNSPVYVKVDEDSADADWVQVMIKYDEGTTTMEGAVTFGTDTSLYFRDSGLRLYSSGDGILNITLTGTDSVQIGDGTNYTTFATDGEVNMAGTAKVTKRLQLPIAVGAGDATVSMIVNAPSIDFNADGEIFYASFVVPYDWDGVSDMYYDAMVHNEIAETDGDDVSITMTVAGWADGETATAVGQTVAIAQELTGGDEAIGKVNLCTGTIDWNEATYPMVAGDVVYIKAVVNLAGAGECTGPLHIVSHNIRYTASRHGQATT